MAAIKLPEAGPLANLVRIMLANNESPCGQHPSVSCAPSTAMTAFALHGAGSNLLKLYNGRRCSHGYPSSGGPMAYLLDNFAGMHAIKGPCSPDWKSLLNGTVAILMYKGIFGLETNNAFDIWAIDKCAFGNPFILSQGKAQELWIWPLGKAAAKLSSAKKKHHHKAKAKVAIF